MKHFRLTAATLCAFAILASCNGSKEQQPTAEETLQLTQTELAQAVANQDSLLSLMNDIAADMARIKQLENILSNPSALNAETPDRREEIKADLLAVQTELQARRERLDALEKKLKNSQYQNATLKKSIETLKAQIADQEGTISSLKESLAQANIHIEALTRNVDSLNSTVAIVNQAREAAETKNTNLSNEMATCYYALGSKKELKEHKLIETGFLKKTKVLAGDYEMSFFTRADKRTLSLLPLHSNKAKVLTNQPADSYTITTDANGMKSLQITNPDRFWKLSNFLIIQID